MRQTCHSLFGYRIWCYNGRWVDVHESRFDPNAYYGWAMGTANLDLSYHVRWMNTDIMSTTNPFILGGDGESATTALGKYGRTNGALVRPLHE